MRIVAAVLLLFGTSLSSSFNAWAKEPEAKEAGAKSDLHFVEIGKAGGTPLVALNGGPGFDHRYLAAAPVWGELAKGRQIIFYDQRGTGDSPAATADALTVDRMVADLEALRRRLKAERIDLLGHSWGGILSMAYATRHPDRVAHLILVGSGDARLATTEYLFDKLYPDIMATIPPDPSPAGQTGCIETDAYDRMSYYDQRNRAPDPPGSPPRFSSEIRGRMGSPNSATWSKRPEPSRLIAVEAAASISE
ncbi:alpha/beta fold hydrolase [Sphingomonas cavernae]|uniref:Proline iminopeptidase n=1 Tax=Sphingomonas cavernae TaxID=2320861 RepID=A0A418WJV1_9SPHN|nr:alpha/beta fold hydrolase [Sphingomonas cavernae]RJF90298.1 alpha/beta fold hydrolase [Sphingomonas cavernae]